MAKGKSGLNGPSLGKSSGKVVKIVGTEDVWSYRHDPNNAPFVDAMNTGVAAVQNDFPDIMNSVQYVLAAELDGSDKTSTLGYYDFSTNSVALNTNFTDVDKMNAVYDSAVKSGYHPSRGNKTGTEAVAIHEMGHALTDYVAKKMGATDLDDAAEKIVKAAYKANKGTGGTKTWASSISGYAQENYAECVAEAVADYYCNGNSASTASKAIMNQLNKYK